MAPTPSSRTWAALVRGLDWGHRIELHPAEPLRAEPSTAPSNTLDGETDAPVEPTVLQRGDEITLLKGKVTAIVERLSGQNAVVVRIIKDEKGPVKKSDSRARQRYGRPLDGSEPVSRFRGVYWNRQDKRWMASYTDADGKQRHAQDSPHTCRPARDTHPFRLSLASLKSTARLVLIMTSATVERVCFSSLRACSAPSCAAWSSCWRTFMCSRNDSLLSAAIPSSCCASVCATCRDAEHSLKCNSSSSTSRLLEVISSKAVWSMLELLMYAASLL